MKNVVRIERVAEYDGMVTRTKADFHMLQKMDGKVVFIHIPAVKNVSEDMMAEIREKFSDEQVFHLLNNSVYDLKWQCRKKNLHFLKKVLL